MDTRWTEAPELPDIDRIRWNRKYSDPSFVSDWAPDVILAERISQLPKGRALDVACGMGSNALFLAKRGYKVDAVDLSDVAIERLRRAAHSEGVIDDLHLMLGDLDAQPLEAEAYQLVVCFRFLSRQAAPKIFAALQPGGVLIYHSFTTAHRKYRPEFREDLLLAPGELRQLFADLEEMDYQEVDDGAAATATFIGRKR